MVATTLENIWNFKLTKGKPFRKLLKNKKKNLNQLSLVGGFDVRKNRQEGEQNGASEEFGGRFDR